MVTDFGVAKAIGAAGSGSSSTSVGIALGTPAHMAPEQGTADPESDQRVDLYALGAVAYEMLSGATLFPGRTPQQVLVAHAVEAPKPVRELRPDAPAALAELIAQCLAKDPAQRPANARAVLQELERIMSGAAPSGAGRSSSRRACSRSPRSSWRAAI